MKKLFLWIGQAWYFLGGPFIYIFLVIEILIELVCSLIFNTPIFPFSSWTDIISLSISVVLYVLFKYMGIWEKIDNFCRNVINLLIGICILILLLLNGIVALYDRLIHLSNF